MTGAQYRKISLVLTHIKNGNREAFTEIYEEYEKKIYFLCSKLLNNGTDAKKMTIDLLDFIYLNCSGFTKADIFEKWLYNNLFTKCRRFIIDNSPERFGDYIDTNAPEGEQIDILMAEDADAMMANENGIDISVDMMQTVDSIISDMPLKQCTAMFMYYFCGFDIEESASLLQISRPAVKNRLYKAHIALETAEHKYAEMGYDVNGIVVFLPEVLSVMADSIVVPEDIAAGVTASTGVNCMKIQTTAASKSVKNNNGIDPYATMVIQTPSNKKGRNYTTANYATPVTAKKSAGQEISPAVKIIMAVVAILIIIGGTVAVVLAVQSHKNADRDKGSVAGIESTEVPKTIVVSTTENTTRHETTTEITTETTTEITTETTTETTTHATTEAPTTAAPTTAAPTTEAPVVTTEPQTTAPAQIDPEPDEDDLDNDNLYIYYINDEAFVF